MRASLAVANQMLRKIATKFHLLCLILQILKIFIATELNQFLIISLLQYNFFLTIPVSFAAGERVFRAPHPKFLNNFINPL